MNDGNFDNLRGFSVDYDTVVAGKASLMVNNSSGCGLISIVDKDSEGELSALVLPREVAIKLAMFIIGEFINDAKGPKSDPHAGGTG
jgi:hypothetical protein